MTKYKLISNTTSEEHLCDKVTIDEFDYYVSDDLKVGDKVRLKSDINVGQVIDDINKDWRILWFKPIATNNPNIDITQVVDEVEKMSWDMVNLMTKLKGHYERIAASWGFKNGYNKSQETHPFSKEDMIDFAEWCQLSQWNFNGNTKTWWSINYTALFPTTKELLQLWKEQKPKIVYYE